MKKLFLCFIIIAFTGCSTISGYFGKKEEPAKPMEPTEGLTGNQRASEFNGRMVLLADQLDRNLTNRKAADSFIVTSFVNLDKLGETTSFGRLIAENILHELQVRKWQVFEVRLNKGIVVNDAGEFSLSRDINKLKDEFRASGIVTGTYSVTNGQIVLNARVIDINRGIVLSSGQAYIPASWFSDVLLSGVESPKMKIINDGTR